LEKTYRLKRDKKKKKIKSCNLKKIDGYLFTPKNKIKYPGITVTKFKAVKPEIIENLLKKKVKKKLELYLQYLFYLLNETDGEPGATDMVLDDLARYQQMVKNCYQKYLGEQYILELEKQIEYIKFCAKQREQELYQIKWMEQMEEDLKRAR
jgi:hypothetical protein